MAGRAGPKLGFRYGRPDLESVGLFAEMGYLPGPYVKPFREVPTDRAKGGASFLVLTPKTKTAVQDCYFDKNFKRIFEKEAFYDAFGARLREEKQESKKNRTAAFINVTPSKWSSTPGDHFGTFSEQLPAFSPLKRPEKKEKALKNFELGRGREGGPGYIDITLNKYPEYKGSPFDVAKAVYIPIYKAHVKKFKGIFLSGGHPQPLFNPNPYKTDKIEPTYRAKPREAPLKKTPFTFPGGTKKIGGDRWAGCFSRPTYVGDKFLTPREADRILESKVYRVKPVGNGIFMPNIGIRSCQTKSVANYNVDFRIHAKNWKNAKPLTYPKPCD